MIPQTPSNPSGCHIETRRPSLMADMGLRLLFSGIGSDASSEVSQVTQQPSSSSKSMRLPLRPGNGSTGVTCVVKANHFFADLACSDVHQYDVTVTPVATSRVNRDVMEQLVKLYKESHLGHRLPAYDGRKILYTAGPLPFIAKEFKITLLNEDEDDGTRRGEREFNVMIKFAARVDLNQLRMFLEGRQKSAPQAVLHFMNNVLQQVPVTRYCPVGRSFYSPDIGQTHLLGEGLESWRGFHQSIRPTQMGLSLNIDMSSTVFMESLPVIKFVMQLLARKDSSCKLFPSDRLKVENALRGVKVEVIHRGKMRRKYRVVGLTSQRTEKLTFAVDDQGTMKSVVEYFREKYQLEIRHIQWPCLQVGNLERPNYLPMEVCKIVEGQRYSKSLDASQITALREVTCQCPLEMENEIIKVVRDNAYDEHPLMKEFKIKISENLVPIEARILPAPVLQYHETSQEKNCLPQVGQWSMKNKKMAEGGVVKNWICINFSATVQCSVDIFCYYIGHTCNTLGMAFNPVPVLPSYQVLSYKYSLEKVLRDQVRDALLKLKGEQLDLLIAILPERKGSFYGCLKRICETELGIVSQCCSAKYVMKMTYNYHENLALKINTKVGGSNAVLADAILGRLPVVNRPTIIIGADVSHPHSGKDSSPSIAAVVASQDWPQMTKYAGLVCAQAPRQELIEDLFKSWHDPVSGSVTGGMIKELLISFRRETGLKPHHIIFYRDGVSEGQFYKVLRYELDAIHKACASLESNYKPTVTFVVVQKRHHTRFFANSHCDRNSVDSSGNILPGTVVDSKICHPTEFDFYLCSHAGIRGTSRPAHYHVLWDENGFTADTLQSLTNKLCYTCARSTRSVSIVPPVYYAHLAARRGRCYIEPKESDTGSMINGENAGQGLPGASAFVRPLPASKESDTGSMINGEKAGHGLPGASAFVRSLPASKESDTGSMINGKKAGHGLPGASAFVRDLPASKESDTGSMINGEKAGHGLPCASAFVRPLPALKENVKRVMFYC